MLFVELNTPSLFSKRTEQLAHIVEKYEFDNPGIRQKQIEILKDVFKGCKDKYFNTFRWRCTYDSKFEHKTSGEVFHFTISNDFKLFLSRTERLCKKVDENGRGGYKFNEIMKLTTKINSSPRYINPPHC